MGFNWAQLDIGYRDHWWSPTSNSSMLISTAASGAPGSGGFVDLAVNASVVDQQLVIDATPLTSTPADYGPDVGVGARPQVPQHQELGVRLDADEVQGHLFLGFRALDYRYRFGDKLAVDARSSERHATRSTYRRSAGTWEAARNGATSSQAGISGSVLAGE